MDITPIEAKSARRLAALVAPHVDSVMIDPLNYQGQVADLYRRHGWAYALTADYARETAAELRQLLPR